PNSARIICATASVFPVRGRYTVRMFPVSSTSGSLFCSWAFVEQDNRLKNAARTSRYVSRWCRCGGLSVRISQYCFLLEICSSALLFQYCSNLIWESVDSQSHYKDVI